MSDRVLITTGDLEFAVRVNAQLEGAGFETELATSAEEVRAALRRREPACVVFTGGLHEASTAQLLSQARDLPVSTLGILEATEPEPKEFALELGLTGYLVKGADLGEVAQTVRRLIERRRLQERTGIIGESAAACRRSRRGAGCRR